MARCTLVMRKGKALLRRALTDRPTAARANAHTCTYLTRMQFATTCTEGRHSARLVHAYIHIYTHAHGTTNVATGYEDVHTLKVTVICDQNKMLLKVTLFHVTRDLT